MRKIALYIQSLFYLLAGINHFRKPAPYLGLIPPYIPWHETVNILAGAAEIIFGLLLLSAKTRKWGAYGIIIILIAFIPAHIYFIEIGNCIPGGRCFSAWVGWVRLLLLQPLLIAWAWWCRKLK